MPARCVRWTYNRRSRFNTWHITLFEGSKQCALLTWVVLMFKGTKAHEYSCLRIVL